MTIEKLIFEHAQTTPQKTALIQGQSEVPYELLWKEIEKAASWFKQFAEPGDRVIISASKNIEFVYTYFGAHLAGMICVPIDPETNEKRLHRINEVAQPKLIVGELRNHGEHEVIPFSDVRSEREYGFDSPIESNVADLLFTTGTTGLPKGVALTYANQMTAMERCHVTGFGMVPASWAYILKMSGEKIGQFAGQLKYIEIGSAFMPLENKQKLMTLLPNTRICMHYGLTEASRSAFISFHDDTDHLMSAGRPSPNTEIAVFSEQGKRLEQNEDGEICVKGGHVCSDYWGLPKEEFQKDFFDGYFRTGDWGHIDEDGYIHLISRKKEIINVGGKKVSPIEVEEVLNEMEGIKESACVGVHDDVLGEVVKAFCVCSKAVDFEEVKKNMMKKLEGYKIPAFFETIDALPKTQNGKLQRLLLK